MPTTPSRIPEPEIEFLGRLARRFLWVLRRAFWIAGAIGIGYGIWTMFTAGKPPNHSPSALGVVWLCAGLPVLSRVDWLFGRGKWLALGVGLVLWFATSLLPDDEDYGYILRFFASLVACMSLIVWRTLWRLTQNAPVSTNTGRGHEPNPSS